MLCWRIVLGFAFSLCFWPFVLFSSLAHLPFTLQWGGGKCWSKISKHVNLNDFRFRTNVNFLKCRRAPCSVFNSFLMSRLSIGLYCVREEKLHSSAQYNGLSTQSLVAFPSLTLKLNQDDRGVTLSRNFLRSSVWRTVTELLVGTMRPLHPPTHALR